MSLYNTDNIYHVFIGYTCVHVTKIQGTTSLNMKGNIKVLLSKTAAMQ